jgi:hypothetical protein
MSNRLVVLAADAIGRALWTRGWKPQFDLSYERPLTKPFTVGAQLWIDETGLVETRLYVACTPAEQVLLGLGREEVARIDADDDAVPDFVFDGDAEKTAGRLADAIVAAAAPLEPLGASADAFIAALDREEAPVVAPAVLAVSGRRKRARRLAREVPGFGDRFEGWLDGAPLEPEHAEEIHVDWREAFKRRPPQSSEKTTPGELFRLARSAWRILRDDSPPVSSVPGRTGTWVDVQLNDRAAAVLERIRAQHPLESAKGLYIAVVLDGTRVRVDGEEIGAVSGVHDATLAVSGELIGTALRVQLPE